MNNKFIADYDIFSEGETWYTEKEIEMYVEISYNAEVCKKFKKGSEIEINKIDRSGGYGTAYVLLNGYKTRFSLDELWDATFPD